MSWFRDKNALNIQGVSDSFFDYLVGLVVTNFPQIPLCNNLKSFLMRKRGAIVGKNIKILPGVWIDRYNNIFFGDNISLARNVIIVGAGGVKLGDDVMVGYNTVILSVDHVLPETKLESIRFSGGRLKPVKIGNGVWIGANVVIRPGITVGKGSVIGAGSVVVKDVDDYTIVAGVPAKIIGVRK